MSSPNFRSHPCSSFESVPPRPNLPKNFCATDSTYSYVISTRIKIGVSSYVSNVAQEGFFLLGCFPSKTDLIVSFIVPIQSSANSYGYKTPSFYLPHTNKTALRNFPFRTRFKTFLWRSAVVWLPQDFPRYPIAELYVSFASLPNAPRFHKSSRNKTYNINIMWLEIPTTKQCDHLRVPFFSYLKNM